jgi:hypothetical protein
MVLMCRPRSVLEGLDEILTVTRIGLPKELRRALACTNIVENVLRSASRLPQREAMAISFNDIALDRGGDAGSSQRLPPTEGTQTTSSVNVPLWKHIARMPQLTASLLAKPTPA